MRIDKLTTQLQQALGEAQSLALANDNQYIDPLHLLVALVSQPDGSGRALLERAGVRIAALKSAAESAIKRLPQVSGTGGEVQVGRELINLLNLAEKESMKRGDQFVATEMFLLALSDDKGEAGRVAREAGLSRKPLEATIEAVRGGAKVASAEAEGQREALKKIHHRPDRAGASGKARSGNWTRRRNSSCHPDSAATHQEQPGAHR